VAPAYDVDGDGTTDMPAYQMDFLGNWTANKWSIGETCPPPVGCPAQDMVDFIKYRIKNPAETEQVWDLYTGDAFVCGSFVGYLDGPVRVVRVIQGAASGALTRKLEFAYPGETFRRVYQRVHRVGGPVYGYADLDLVNTSPVLSRAKVFREGLTTEGDPYDEVNGQQTAKPQPGREEWYQVSSDIGSFLFLYGEGKFSSITSRNGRYNDSSTADWLSPILPDWDQQDGDYALSTTEWKDILDTENFLECVDPTKDMITPIHEDTSFMLSPGRAAANAGEQEVARRDRGVLSQVVEEEQRDTPCCGGGSPCIPTLNISYNRDGGPVQSSTSTSGCPGLTLGWNLYQSLGAGVYRRLASLGPGDSFHDPTLVLNELRTYRATSLGSSGAESAMSASVTVLHDDIVAPPPPVEVVAVAGTGTITVSWDLPAVGDLKGFRVLVGQQSGGPYTQAHTGLLGPLTRQLLFQAVSGGTYYLVVTALDYAGNESSYSTQVSVTVP
jgi:hypothetical protein